MISPGNYTLLASANQARNAEQVGDTVTVLSEFKMRLLGPACQAGRCDSRAVCRSARICLVEADRLRRVREEADLLARQRAETAAAEQRRIAEERAKKRAEEQAAMRAHWDRMAEAGRKARLEREARMTPEEREAEQMRQRQGPRMRM